MSIRGDARPQLYLIADVERFPHDLAGRVARALEGGVDWVQLRGRGAPASRLFALACELGRCCRRAGAALIVNDRVDVARAAGADGAHLGAEGLPPGAARALLAPWQILGCSAHTPHEAAEAARTGVDYVIFGHVFETASHPGAAPRGIPALRRAVEESAVPVVAVGGITPDNAAEVASTGCAGVAVVGAVLGAADPKHAAESLRRVLDARAGPRAALRRRLVGTAADPLGASEGSRG